MIFDFILNIANALLNFVANIIPDYASLPFPEVFTTNIELLIGHMKLIVEIPVIREIYALVITFFIPLALLVFGYRTIINVISAIPTLGGVKNLSD